MARFSKQNSSYNRKGSRYNSGGAVERFSNRLGWWERAAFRSSETDITYQIDSRSAGRPDIIASDVYDDPKLMWVVLQTNNIIDINTEMTPGVTLTLPTKERVFSTILTNVP